jgi:hypothetical protein
MRLAGGNGGVAWRARLEVEAEGIFPRPVHDSVPSLSLFPIEAEDSVRQEEGDEGGSRPSATWEGGIRLGVGGLATQAGRRRIVGLAHVQASAGAREAVGMMQARLSWFEKLGQKGVFPFLF